MPQYNIPFSPPDITESEIKAVTNVLKSGWITTGPKTREFEEALAGYYHAPSALALSSATAGLELILRLLGIGKGDEVITSAYTYSASAAVILHTGARPVFADIDPETLCLDPKSIAQKMTRRTRAVLPVDFGGLPCDYDGIFAALEEKQKLFRPKKNTPLEDFTRPVVIADAAHSFGSRYGKGALPADFSVFSFHAVKNLTTAEGGALFFREENSALLKALRLLSLHGQSKDAHSKMQAGNYRYDIVMPGYKANMTDITAALGLAQLSRYDTEILPKRKALTGKYNEILNNHKKCILPVFQAGKRMSSHHLYALRLRDYSAEKRDRLISSLAEIGIATNVHYVPLPLFTAYRNLGYDMKGLPNTQSAYETEITLPLYSNMDIKLVDIVCEELLKRI